jgi:hypothetical protein
MVRRISTTLFCVVALLSLASPSSGRNWYVAQNGSGDAPTIEAAIDSTVSGDVIVVGSGNYPVGSVETGGVVLKSGTTIVSESGPVGTMLFAADGPIQSSVLSISDGCTVRGLTITGGQGSAVFCNGVNMEVTNNIVHGRLLILGPTVVHHNLVDLPGAQSQAVDIGFGVPVQLYNNIILGEVAYDGTCAFQTSAYCNLIQELHGCFGGGTYANFSADPLFCVGGYYLRSDSPCAPGNVHGNVSCGQIGPLPVACGTVSVEARTWGAVKAMYKN